MEDHFLLKLRLREEYTLSRPDNTIQPLKATAIALYKVQLKNCINLKIKMLTKLPTCITNSLKNYTNRFSITKSPNWVHFSMRTNQLMLRLRKMTLKVTLKL